MACLTENLPMLEAWGLLSSDPSLGAHPFPPHHKRAGTDLPQTSSPNRSPLLPSSSPLYLSALCLARCWRWRWRWLRCSPPHPGMEPRSLLGTPDQGDGNLTPGHSTHSLVSGG